MSISATPFGRVEGREATLYTLTNTAGAQLKLCDYGARIVSVVVPDKHGQLADVCLGFDDISGYIENAGSYLGGTIGRVCNRIAGASFPLNGKDYPLYANEKRNTLHGGAKGFDRRWWQCALYEGAEADVVAMTYDSPDGEEGFPGALSVSVSFAWTDHNELTICYQATAKGDTVCNLTNHAYFNLAGGGDVLGHQVMINAAHMTETGGDLIPTGRDIPVDGTPFDLRNLTPLRDGLSNAPSCPALAAANGYDVNYAVAGDGMRQAAVVREPVSGRQMRVLSTEPCVQFYTGQGLDCTGRGGAPYGAYAGLALETQHHPDAIHHPNFPSIVLRDGAVYQSQTVYCFLTEQ